ncbi:hypothetical protein JCGZ_14831 [Jatropha curcas]|uniref:TIR domain-containing protein n=1 Tax=Jatropha curcas TaxID=180498 RepID=A0A067K5V4_JATCU|nr:hypothetical protein JCGZ_14831 [Jatropha curcas]
MAKLAATNGILFGFSTAALEAVDRSSIDPICKQSQDYNFCMQILITDPRTLAADMHGLEVISISLTVDQIQTTSDNFASIGKGITDPVGKKRLGVCISNYSDALTKFQNAFQSASNKAYLDVIGRLRDGFNKIVECENVYRMGEPIAVCPVSANNNFVTSLHNELSLKGINIIKDEGKSLETDFTAMEESLFLVVVLSENYISSAECLDKLVKIIDFSETTTGHVVVPIFFNVDPSDVKNQRRMISEAFTRHEENFKEEMEKVQRWRQVLTKVATICGWESQQWEEMVLIEQIVTDISDKLDDASSNNTNDFVGMGSHIIEMEKILCLESNVVHMVGIWGMGGIGKTTVARVIYDMICSQFEIHCFSENIKENFRRHGIAFLLQKILIEKKSLSTWSFNASLNVIKRRLCHKKVLLVLDDVDDLTQLEALAREPNWFGQGSRIIITTRDKHLLVAHGVQSIYEVQYPNSDQALQLFSQYAFKQNNPKIEYLDLSQKFTSYVKGLPLALKVLGSFLNETSLIEWQRVQDKLAIIPDLNVNDVLKISFDGLDDTQKEAFLDIACFYNMESKEIVRNVFEACGFFPDITFAVLKDKALIRFSLDNKLLMHDLLQEMGREIVRQESKEPGKRSRLWIPEEIHQVLTKNKLGVACIIVVVILDDYWSLAIGGVVW